MRTNEVWKQKEQNGISYLFDATKKHGLDLGLSEIWWLPGPSGGAWDLPEADALYLAKYLEQGKILSNIKEKK